MLATDLSNDAELQSLKTEVERHFGQLNILVMCAGEIARGLIESASVANFDIFPFSVDLKGDSGGARVGVGRCFIPGLAQLT